MSKLLNFVEFRYVLVKEPGSYKAKLSTPPLDPSFLGLTGEGAEDYQAIRNLQEQLKEKFLKLKRWKPTSMCYATGINGGTIKLMEWDHGPIEHRQEHCKSWLEYDPEIDEKIVLNVEYDGGLGYTAINFESAINYVLALEDEFRQSGSDPDYFPNADELIQYLKTKLSAAPPVTP